MDRTGERDEQKQAIDGSSFYYFFYWWENLWEARKNEREGKKILSSSSLEKEESAEGAVSSDIFLQSLFLPSLASTTLPSFFSPFFLPSTQQITPLQGNAWYGY